MVAAAVGAAAAVAGTASQISSQSKQAAAAKKAAGKAGSAANSANDTQLQMYNQTRSDQLPQINAGRSASNQIAYLMGLVPSNADGASSGSTGGINGMFGSPATSAATADNPYTGATVNPSYAAIADYTFNPNSGQYELNPNRKDYKAAYGPLTAQQYQNEKNLEIQNMPSTSTTVGPNNGYGDTVNPSTGTYGSLSKNFTSQDFLNNMDPAYQWDIDQGTAALQRTQSANGGLLSGAAAKGISDYTTNQASNEYGNAYNRFNTNQTNLYNRLAGIAGTGQQGASNVGTSGTNAANQIGSNTIGAANASGAAGIVGSNAQSAGLGSIAGLANNQGFTGGLNSLFGSGGANTGIPSGGFAGATGIPFNTQYE